MEPMEPPDPDAAAPPPDIEGTEVTQRTRLLVTIGILSLVIITVLGVILVALMGSDDEDEVTTDEDVTTTTTTVDDDTTTTTTEDDDTTTTTTPATPTDPTAPTTTASPTTTSAPTPPDGFDPSDWIGTILTNDDSGRTLVDGEPTGYFEVAGACMNTPSLCAYSLQVSSAVPPPSTSPTDQVLVLLRRVGNGDDPVWQVTDARAFASVTEVWLACRARGDIVAGIWPTGGSGDRTPPASVWGANTADEKLVEIPPSEATCETFDV